MFDYSKIIKLVVVVFAININNMSSLHISINIISKEKYYLIQNYVQSILSKKVFPFSVHTTLTILLIASILVFVMRESIMRERQYFFYEITISARHSNITLYLQETE